MDSASIKISVVVTSYNLEKFICDCIDSVLSQTRPPDEIILADDASCDETVRLASERFPDLIVVKHENNRGALLNTLSGLLRSTGDVVAFIDGDDTWPDNKLERAEQEFVANPDVILVTHAHRRVNEIGLPTYVEDDTHRNMERIFREGDGFKRQLMLRESAILRRGIWFGSAYSIRRSALNLGRFSFLVNSSEESRFSYLDLVLAPYLVKANPNGIVCYMPDVIFDYRVHANNSAASNTLDKQFKALTRVRATNALTWKMLNSLGEDGEVDENYRLILLEYDFLGFLYRKHYVTALCLLVKLTPYLLRRGKFQKELIRFFGVFLLGPHRFLKVK